MKYLFLFASALSMVLWQPANAGNVVGSVSGRWTLEGSPYVVTGDLTVARGERLEIDYGVEVVFSGNYTLTVEGVLQAGSTGNRGKRDEDHGVRFKASDAAADGWGGIRFLKAGAGCKLVNFEISDVRATTASGAAIYCESTDLEIVNAAIDENRAADGAAIMYLVDSDATLTNVAFAENRCEEKCAVLSVRGGEIDLTNAAISENDGLGMWLQGGAQANLTNIAISEQSGDGGWGIVCDASEVRIVNGAVAENHEGGIKLMNSARANLTACAVSGKNALSQDESSKLTTITSVIGDD